MITVGNFVITRKHLFISGAPLAGFLLFLFMVALISTGDAGDINKGRKIGNVIMPEREIETLLTDEIEPPQEPETAPPEIAPPQLDVTPLIQVVDQCLETENTFLYSRFNQYTHVDLKKEEQRVL